MSDTDDVKILFDKIKEKIGERISSGEITVRPEYEYGFFTILWRGHDKNIDKELFFDFKVNLDDLVMMYNPIELISTIFVETYERTLERMKNENQGSN